MTGLLTAAARPFLVSAAAQRVAAASLRTAQPAATADLLVSLAVGEPSFGTPGSEFGQSGERHIRLSYAADPDAITTGLTRIRAAFTQL